MTTATATPGDNSCASPSIVAPVFSRTTWVWLHRWAGLVMTSFLVVAGLTGALLAWRDPLERALWAPLGTVAAPWAGAKPIDPFDLRDRALAEFPNVNGDRVYFNADKPGRPRYFELRASTTDDEIYLDPYTGKELGRRKDGDITQGLKNLMPFIYRLHYSLALGTIGTYAFGIIALLWTLDCLVGAYLTFPRGRPFLAKWRPAWSIRYKRFNFDLHRAGGLWVWAMLFVFAWSSVGFNLTEVYTPVMRIIFDYHDDYHEIPNLSTPQRYPGIDFRTAHLIGRRLAGEEAERLGFSVQEEKWLIYIPEKASYLYGLKTTRDVSDAGGGTAIFFDANTGELQRTSLPTSLSSGATVSNWLSALHMAKVGGTAFKVFVSAMGVMVAALSMTGVVIWWRKRRARRFPRL